MRMIMDSRESADPHPWLAHFSDDVTIERAALDVGDFALAALPGGAVVERKSKMDYLAALGSQRERFERMLARSRHCGSFCIVVESSFAQVIAAGRGMNHHAIIGSTASWSRRFGPIVFCDTPALAAEFAERFLRGQIKEAQRTAKAIQRAEVA